MIHTEREGFGVEPCDQYTLRDVVAWKHGEGSRTYKEVVQYFQPLLSTSIRELQYPRLLEHCKKLLSTEIRVRGCARTDTGIKKKPHPKTILRKFAYVSSAINAANKEGGYGFDNHALKVTAYLRKLIDGAE